MNVCHEALHVLHDLQEMNKPKKSKKSLTVLEIFAGSMTLSKIAAANGDRVLQPVDLHTGFDLSKPKDRRTIIKLINKENPDITTISYPCTPWSTMQNISKDKPGRKEALRLEREEHIQYVKFAQKILRNRELDNKTAVAENPQLSEAWQVGVWPGKHAIVDQCRLGLQFPTSKKKIRKITRLQCVPGELAEDMNNEDMKCKCTKQKGEHV